MSNTTADALRQIVTLSEAKNLGRISVQLARRRPLTIHGPKARPFFQPTGQRPKGQERLSPSHIRFTAANRQTSKHRPHLMQRNWSMMCGSLRTPLMQVTGQLRAQTVQPTHLSALIS